MPRAVDASTRATLSEAAASARCRRPPMQGKEQGERRLGESDNDRVEVRWGIRIPLRDGILLNATLYAPRELTAPMSVIFTLTPYIAQTYHDRGIYFAARGYPFLTVDVRGRGDSEGVFKPNINEGRDGYDVVEWLARQSYCSGQVAMWGGSYAGYDQWATAAQLPPHLATIVPVAAPCFSVDFPIRSNIAMPYWMQWLTLVGGRASHDRIFGSERFWADMFRRSFERGLPFRELDAMLGNPSECFQEWVAHPQQDEYWDRYNPTTDQYARLSMPILTITGIYDGDQLGALTHYRRHIDSLASSERSRHYLIIGPWDHAGTRTPVREFAGLRVGDASLVDLAELHLQWYDWTMRKGPKPTFLRSNVAYYMMVVDEWRYADSLEEVTAGFEALYLQSQTNPTDVFLSGGLGRQPPSSSEPDHYVSDPRDVSLAALECTVDPANRVDQRLAHARSGKHLVYHTAAYQQDLDIAGFFRLTVWLSIDQPDTDFVASIYDVSSTGEVVQLTTDVMRARYRESLRTPKLIESAAPLRYDFETFAFVARRISAGHRLRLVFGPINSINSQKNYNSGGVVAEESARDARPVTVKLLHDEAHPSALYVPVAGSSPHARR